MDTMLFEVCLLCLPVLAKGFLFDSIGVIDPNHDVYLRAGDNLSLNCTLTGYRTPLNASYLYFTKKSVDQKNHELIPKENLQVLGQRKIGLEIHNVKTSDSGWYFCVLNESSIDGGQEFKSINQISVTVSEPPQAITNLTCISDNYEDMTCDWCDQAEPGVRYELHWRIGENVRHGKCQLYERNCRCHFCWKSQGDCISKSQDFFHNVLYIMNVASIRYALKNVSANFRVHASFSKLVKPRPPSQLLASSINSTVIALTWTPPRGLENSWVYPLYYVVSYESTRHPASKKSIVVFNRTSLNLLSLQPYTGYNISITATPNIVTGYHSEEKWILCHTRESEPSASPSFLAGSFRMEEQPYGKRNVDIYFGGIPENEVNGILTGFTVKYTAVREGAMTKEVFLSNNNHTVELSLDNNMTYRVSVAGRTIADGVFSSIYIPCIQDVQQPKHVEGMVSASKTSVQFTIIPPDGLTVDNYTLLYCHGHLVNGLPDHKYCKNGDVPVAETYPGNTSQLLFEGHQADLVYSIAVNYESGTTSGLSPMWLCLYDYAGDPLPPVISYSEEQKENSITLEWEHPQCSREVRGRVSYYRLNVYLEQELILNDSIEAGFHKRMTYHISNLNPYTLYVVMLTACTVVRCSVASKDLRRSPESAPGGPPVNVSAYYQNDAVTIMWQPPAAPNGIITHYYIQITNGSSPAPYRRMVTNDTKIRIENLTGYTNYSVQIEAENHAGKSQISEPVFFSTPIKAPGHVGFKAMLLDQSTIRIAVSPPQQPNGPHPQFLLITSQTSVERNYTVTGQHDLKVDCGGGGSDVVNMSVLAYNVLENGTKLEGPLSGEQSLTVCGMQSATTFNTTVKVIISVIPSIVFIIIIIIIYVCRNHLCDQPPKPIMPPEDVTLQVRHDASTVDTQDEAVTQYIDIYESGTSQQGDSDHDSGINNPQSSDRSQQRSLTCNDMDLCQIQVSSEDERTSSCSSTLLDRCQLSSQPVASRKVIDIYTTAMECRQSISHVTAENQPSRHHQNEAALGFHDDSSVNGEGKLGSSGTALWSSGSQPVASAAHSTPVLCHGYQRGISKEEELVFEVPPNCTQDSSNMDLPSKADSSGIDDISDDTDSNNWEITLSECQQTTSC